MKNHLSEIPYLFKHDSNFRKKLSKVMLLGCFAVIIIAVFVVIGGYFLLTPILSFLLTTFPFVTEMVFDSARGVIATFMTEDLLNLLTPLANNAGVEELKGLIVKYFEQLKNSSGIDFQNFQNFLSTIKGIVSDGQITPVELESVRKLLPNY